MFTLVSGRTAFWPVVWRGLGKEGELMEHSIDIKFLLPDGKEELYGILDRWGAQTEELEGNPDVLASDMAFAREIVADDWQGFVDAKGKPVPFSWAAMRTLINQQGFPEAMGQAFADCFAAIPQARAKNSGPSPDAGPAAGGEAAGGTAKRSARSSNGGTSRKRRSNASRAAKKPPAKSK